MSTKNASPHFEHFLISYPHDFVAHVQINRPSKLNSFHKAMWLELGQIFEMLSVASDVRAVVLSGAGDRAFTTGLDVKAAIGPGSIFGPANDENQDTARIAVTLRRHLTEFQDCISKVENCEKPVICVLHGYTFGLGIDICACADIRICSADTKFSVKEVDIGLAADIGTLTRLPKIVGNFSWVKDVSMSARTFDANEAYRVGFVSYVLKTKDLAIDEALRMALFISSKSPVAVQGTKELLNHARDHTVKDSLQYTGVWNSAAIQTADVEQSVMSTMNKSVPRFEKL